MKVLIVAMMSQQNQNLNQSQCYFSTVVLSLDC